MSFNNNKDYKDYSFDDFMMDDNFINWVQKPSSENEAYWKNVFSQHPEKAALISKARNTILRLRFEAYNASTESSSRVWNRLQDSIQNIQLQSKSRIISLKPSKLLRYAAVFAGLLVFGGYYYYSSFIAQRHINTAFGQMQTVVLPDQSVITLNANSELSYSPNWKKGEVREVWIKGEAYFNVKHLNKNERQIKNEERFIVHTQDMNIEVLGTSFNVNTRHDETRVSLNSGKIKVDLKAEDKKPVFIKPGEAVMFSATKKKYVHTKVNPERLSLWTAKRLSFENTTMLEIARIIEDTYGYKVVFEDPQIQTRTISGTISISNEDVLLKGIEASLQIHIEKDTEHKKLIITNQTQSN